MPRTRTRRREFISTGVAAGAAVLLRPSSVWAVTEATDPRVADIVSKTIGIDTHNHIDVPLTDSEMPGRPISTSLAK